VPLDVFHSTDKGLKVGYTDDSGKQHYIWISKRLLYQRQPNHANLFDNEPKEMLKIDSRVWYDSQEFFKEYAEYIDRVAPAHKIKVEARRAEEDREFNEKMEAEVRAFLAKIGAKLEKVEWEERGTGKANVGNAEIRISNGGIGDIALRTEKSHVRTKDKGAGMAAGLVDLAKEIGVEITKLLDKVEQNYESMLKSHDWSYNYADDRRSWKQGSWESDQIGKYGKILRENGREEAADSLYAKYSK
jgi:hypothetical protein